MSSPDGFTSCFQGKLSDAGILAKPATAVATPEAAPATTDVAAAPVAPAVPAPKPAETAVPLAPTFGMRVEPDGSTVIAGSGTPGSEIDLYANGALLGKTKVEPSGDWVFVPEKPLPTGGVELTLGEAGSTARAAQSFVVVIDPDKKAEPLVVASVPGKASEVLQGLAKPSAPAATAVAKLETPVAPPAAPVAEVPAPVAETPAAPVTAPAEPKVAAVEPNTPAPAAPATENVAVLPPSIDAIEIDGGRNFFAGGGAEGATVRLYVDDTFIADSTVRDGRWLVETDNVLTKPSQRIRVDMLKPDSADVASRAEVDFKVNLPTTKPAEPATQVATAPTPATKSPAPAADAPVASTEAPAPAAPAVTAPAAPTIAAPTVNTPTAAPPVAVAAPAAPTIAPVTLAPTQQAAAPTAPTAPTAPASTPAAPEAQIAETPATTEATVPTLVATQVGNAEDQRFASGKAIIRRGDNLWTIARRVYGEGIKYTTIYEANGGQIRNPNKIYPGQVFNLPTGQ